MIYLIIFIVLMIAELIYFRIAIRFNIIDKPNDRSSHKIVVLRGGGIIFTIGLIAYFTTHQFTYPWFIVGLVTVAVISFADDVRHQPSWLRIILQTLSIAFLLYQFYVLNLFQLNPIVIITIFLLGLFFINAYNFMDGINGMTSSYSFTVLGALLYLNHQLKLLDQDVIIYLTIGNLVFFIFNFRMKAKCFAGDVGSIAMAFSLLFISAGILLKTGNFIFTLLFAVYVVDAGLTIFYRLLKKENIFNAHRQHLYQYLANEMQWPQLSVSLLYMVIQTVISAGVCIFWQKSWIVQAIFFVIVWVCLTLIYFFSKRYILKKK